MIRATLASLVVCGCAVTYPCFAQEMSPDLKREVTAVRENVARSLAALSKYKWTEHTQVLVKGKVHSTRDMSCRYDSEGKVQKTPIGPVKEDKTPDTMSKRPANRKKADMADYVERSITLVHSYLPPKPDQLQFLLEHGYASVGQAGQGMSEIRFKRYLMDGDSLVYTYDSVSKALRRIDIKSNLGSEKDPVTMAAEFESLPGGVNHLSKAKLNAPAKKVEVNTQNSDYEKISN